MSLWRRSKHEIWLSVATLVVGALCLQPGAPEPPRWTIGFPIVLLFAWLFALDAVLDLRRTHLLAFIPIMAWFLFLSYILPFVLYDSFTTRVWADR